MPGGFRQEVFNVVLAQLLRERGVITAPENMLNVGVDRNRRMPDLLVNYQGLRTAIEGEVASATAQQKAVESAGNRVREGIAHIGVAIVYPQRLRHGDFAMLRTDLQHAELDIAIVTESGNSGFVKGDVNYLASALSNTFDQLVNEDVVAQAVAELDAGIERFAGIMRTKPGIMDRIGIALDIHELTDKQKHAVSRIGGLVLTNALIFHEMLSESEPRVEPLHRVAAGATPLAAFAAQWKLILDQINYKPIFMIARDVLLSLTSSADVVAELLDLVSTAQQIITKRAALRHDLMGRIYHRLLVEKKYLGTYYTRIPAATLLLKLALRPDPAEGIVWKDIGEGQELKVADLACGTGTLLMAAAEAISDNYISASAEADEPIDLSNLQRALAEDVIYGYDVLPSAIHLTASTLAIRAPEIAFRKMNMYVLPLGGPQHKLGTIEYLVTEAVQLGMDMFGSMPMTQQVSGEAVTELPSAPIPQLDLCVMNPPFTRSVGGNLLFGNMPQDERDKMQARLSKMLRVPGILANSTAGLGSVFVAVGDKYIKPGGRIALVLPKALLGGVSWNETRDILRRNYVVEYIVVSQDPEHWNFSESTDLSEVLLVARKLRDEESPSDQASASAPVVAVNLWRNPTNAFEALAIAQDLTNISVPSDIAVGQGQTSVKMGDQKVGEALSMPWGDLRKRHAWILPTAFAQSDLARAAYHIEKNRVWLPGQGLVGDVPLTRLGNLGTLGPDRRDIHDGFEHSDARTPYAAFWNHETAQVTTLAQTPNQHIAALARAKPGRTLRRAEDLWARAGKVLLGERLRLNTARMLAIRTSERVLSNVWWTFQFRNGLAGDAAEKGLTLWLNSSLGLLQLLANKEETEGAWVDFKKPMLTEMPVLDIASLGDTQLGALASAYDELATQPIQALPLMSDDPVRHDIDAAIARVLGLPDLAILRTLLAQEPGICLTRL